VTSNDWTSDGEPMGDAADETPQSRAPEFEARNPDLWDELGLVRSDDLPVPASSETNAPETSSEDSEVDGIDYPTVMALLSHLSVLFGLPVFIAPFLFRSDSLSLHHAKAAAIIFFLFYALLGGALLGWPALIPVAMVMYVPALVGIYRAVQGRDAGLLGFGALGEWLFRWPKVR